MRPTRFATVAFSVLAAAGPVMAQQYPGRSGSIIVNAEEAPPIDIWLDQVVFEYGSPIRPYFSTEPGAYVTVVRVTTDGELRIMYPQRPTLQRSYVMNQFVNDRLPAHGDPAMNIYESTGTGFVFALASYRRFDFRLFTQGSQWNRSRLAQFGRKGDAFEIVRRFVDETLPGTVDFSMDYLTYEVYSGGVRSRYPSSYSYLTLDHYLDACLGAFGYRYSYYCRSYYGGYHDGYYGRIAFGNPRSGYPNAPSNPRSKNMKPRVRSPEPVVPRTPLAAPPAEESGPSGTRTDASVERARHERMMRTAKLRVDPLSEPVVHRPAPRSEPPRIERNPEPRSQPVQPAPQPRSEPRAPAPQPADTRSEPARIERPQPAPQPNPEPPATKQ